MAESNHERKAKRILGRDWEDLRERWINYVPHIATPGDPPAIKLHELQDLDRELSGIPASQVKEVFEEIPGLRAGLLHEAVFLAHKASHVLGSSLVHVAQGMCTWSLSSAYHSAFFAMKSILNLLGAVQIESPHNGNFLIDVWGVSQNRKKRKLYPAIILASTGRPEQRHFWMYLQRIVEQTTGLDSVCSSEMRARIMDSGFTDFARQRNDMHYKPVWHGPDLHQCVTQADFGAKRASLFDVTDADHSLMLAFCLVHTMRNMLGEIAGHSAVMDAEVQLIDTWLSQPFNDLYIKCVS